MMVRARARLICRVIWTGHDQPRRGRKGVVSMLMYVD